MMDLSFRWPHPRFDTPVGRVSVRLHTFDNAYGVDPDTVAVTSTDGVLRVESPTLTWAGGQRKSDGAISLRVEEVDGEQQLSVSGRHTEGVRSLAITFHDVPRSDVGGTREGVLQVGDRGRIVRYPNGWFDLASPFVTLTDAEGVETTIRSLDTEPQPKTFAFIPHFDGPALMDVELIVEASAVRPSIAFDAPPWAVTRSVARQAIEVRHREHVHAAYTTTGWDDRGDVPAWAREISLVTTLHGQHFTGRTFLDYDGMLDSIRRITERIEGRRVLAYLPGWEGRYYRWYGSYRPEPTLGGADGFRRLLDGARELGVHVMPMFGANVASRDVPGFERWGEPGVLRRRSGLSDAGSVDWDGGRHYDYGAGALLNLAYAPWRAQLVGQIAGLWEEFGFDATFLDITAMYANDPNGDTTEGLRALVTELHAAMPGHLIGGEAWFDAIGSIIPLVQTGHLENVPVFHDLPDEDLFTVTNRSFGHVCLGDPAFHSSGVHEAGYVTAWRLPVRRGVIPTLGVVDGTLDAAPDRVSQIVDDAHEYADRFLVPTAARLG